MRRAGRVLLWVLGALLLVPVLAVAGVGIGLNTGPGRGLAERLISQLTGGNVTVQGVGGRFPDHLRISHIELKDAAGPYALLDDVQLDWHPTALLQKTARIDRLDVARLQLPRLPKPTPATAGQAQQPSKPFSLPVRIEADHVHVARAEIGAPVLGVPAVLSLDGHASVPSLETPTAHLAVQRLDGAGSYVLDGEVTPDRITAKLTAAEPAGGLVSQAAGLPYIGPLQLDASVAGPRNALQTKATLGAGPLKADASGTVDLAGEALDVQVTASAPAMQPAPEVSWQGIALQAHVQGAWTKPHATGRLEVTDLRGAGAGLKRLTADLGGDAGQVTLHATAEGLRVPGPDAEILAADPLTLDATARLDDPARPVQFALAHPLISARGNAVTAGRQEVTADLTLPQLGPLARVGGVDLQGHTALHIHAAAGDEIRVEADGTLGLTGGLAPLPGLIGDAAKLGLTATLRGSDLTITRFALDGRTVRLTANGSRTGGVLDAQVTAGLTDLSVLAPTVTGAIEASAHVHGPADAIALNGQVEGEVGAPGVPRGPVKLTLALDGLPSAPSGTVQARGTLAGAPLELSLTAKRAADGTVDATIERADWRSLHAEGALQLPAGAKLPVGRVKLQMARLDDLRPFVGQALSGGLDATLELDKAELRLQAEARGAGIPGTRVGLATVTAKVADPLTTPNVKASVKVSGLESASVAGSATIDLSGPQNALAIRSTAALTLSGTPAQLSAAALLDIPEKRVRVETLQVEARGETARLLAPATVSFGGNVAVDRLRVGLRQAVLDVTGTLSPRLDATATLRAPADIAAIAGPEFALDGTVNLDAKITGTPAQPGGTVRLQATGLRMRTGPGRAVPPANVTATAHLNGQAAQIDARLAAGSAQLAIAGQAPLGAGALNLRASGALDLTLLDPILTAGGRQARGRVTLDATVTGTAAAPRVAGTAQLANGEIQDFTQGLRIRQLAATLRADGDTVRIVSLTGRAGPGTVAARGTIGVLAPGIPLDLAITAANARPITSDQLQLELDANLTVRGRAAETVNVGGRVLIRRAEIRIPERLPPTVAALNVIRPGQKTAAPAKAGPTPSVALDLQVDAPQQVFVRGRGVEAEMSGALRIRGNASQPQVSGGLDMRRGLISVAGTTLTFSRGKVGFDGTGVNGKIDPTLDFVADSTAASVTATLAITGYASAPKIKLTSVPELPQDEVLAYLLFRRSVKELGPFQYAEIVAALAQLTGVGGAGLNPLESVRKGLGLDRLSVGGNATGTGASVEAGRYVANGVYLGAKQGTSGGGTGATLQIDITKGLKLQTDVGTGSGGNQVGVTYQFEY